MIFDEGQLGLDRDRFKLDKALAVLKEKNSAGDYIFVICNYSSDDTLPVVAQDITRLCALKNEGESVHKPKMKGSTKSARSVFPKTQAICCVGSLRWTRTN